MANFENRSSERNIRVVLKGVNAEDEVMRQAITDARSRGHKIEVRVTWEGGDAERYAAEAAAAGLDAVVAGGGDGTINEVVRGVLRDGAAGCAVGVVPLGTANDFATAAGIPCESPDAALRIILEQPPVPMDVCAANGRVFVNMASGGVGAEIVAQTSDQMKSILGDLSYSLKGLSKLFTLEPRQLRVTAPDLEWEGGAYAIAAGNARLAGGGYPITPEALVDDGLIDLLIVPDIPLDELLKWMGKLIGWGDQPDDGRIICRQAPHLKVEAVGELPVNLDGEPLRASVFDFEVRKHALRFHLPVDSPILGGSGGQAC